MDGTSYFPVNEPKHTRTVETDSMSNVSYTRRVGQNGACTVPYMTVYLIKSPPKKVHTPYIYVVLANPIHRPLLNFCLSDACAYQRA
jgi:hypothetical protein